ncbi:hypothetical protein RD792_009013 [Penstemon davidsonii]|uniref:Protein phosphatase n=1 Tax=Penstemon davidsonii TaxID=160366 RepID=A0ABR0DAV9_9LAMI|nr:hypothetical protein RD792_009013 [Penstemon davidsonii]
MVSGAFYIPKDIMYNPKGEDAHFICKEKQAIGVADGVGRWIEKGVDSGLYARKLMSNFAAALGNYPTMENNQNIDLKKVLQKAYSKTDNEGSSTTCILTLRENSLHAANVGDSGFLLIRDGVEFYKSPIQIKGFNFPYQLGKSADKPSVAQISTLQVQKGDVVILGTDGLFDNLFTSDIQNLVNLLSGAQPGQVARAVAEHAYYNSIDKLAATPFAKASFADGRVHYGGKKDDITVIVSYIV